jgi:hypothetical protein
LAAIFDQEPERLVAETMNEKNLNNLQKNDQDGSLQDNLNTKNESAGTQNDSNDNESQSYTSDEYDQYSPWG